MKKEIATMGLVILTVASISSLLVNTKLIDATVICVDRRDNTKVISCSDPNATDKNSLTSTNEMLARESNITTSNRHYTLPANSQIQNQTQIQTQTDCKQQGHQLTDRAKSWGALWTNATSDPGGSIRADGRYIVSDVITFLVNCQGSYDKSTLKFWLGLSTVMTAEIAGNINYGPPCTPLCKSGPPIT